MTDGQVQVAVVGTGQIGRGWAALCVAAGWPVAIFDTEAQALDAAALEIKARARRLAALGRAEHEYIEKGFAKLRAGRSLLQACQDAQWVIESILPKT